MKPHPLSLTVALTSILLSACGATTPSFSSAMPAGGAMDTGRSDDLPLRRLIENPASPRWSATANDDLMTAIQSDTAWGDFWLRAAAGQRNPPPPPRVDFGRETVLVVRTKTQTRGGYSVRIERVVERPDHLVAMVRLTSPGPTCGGTAAMTTPMDIVGVPKRTKPVRWVVERDTTDCG